MTFIEDAKAQIETRAREAGMDFDSADIVTAHDFGTTTVFLRRTRKAIHDDEGTFVGYEYEPLIWMEFRNTTVEKVKDGRLHWTEYEPRVVVLCPWLVMMQFPDGTVRDGARKE